MVPKTFCSKPEGDWKRWVGGNVSPADLQRYGKGETSIFINGCMVHALCFPHGDGTDGRIWDCMVGWRDKGML